MKRSYFVCRSLLLTQAFLFLSLQPVASIKGAMTASPIGAQVNPEVQVKVLDKYGKLPPIFEPNSGQTDRRGQVYFTLSRVHAVPYQ